MYRSLKKPQIIEHLVPTINIEIQGNTSFNTPRVILISN